MINIENILNGYDIFIYVSFFTLLANPELNHFHQIEVYHTPATSIEIRNNLFYKPSIIKQI